MLIENDEQRTGSSEWLEVFEEGLQRLLKTPASERTVEQQMSVGALEILSSDIKKDIADYDARKRA